jgi:hypothetical protein
MMGIHEEQKMRYLVEQICGKMQDSSIEVEERRRSTTVIEMNIIG